MSCEIDCIGALLVAPDNVCVRRTLGKTSNGLAEGAFDKEYMIAATSFDGLDESHVWNVLDPVDGLLLFIVVR